MRLSSARNRNRPKDYRELIRLVGRVWVGLAYLQVRAQCTPIVDMEEEVQVNLPR
jgi:hypothetical protein